jgi:hypothetical protein
VPTTFFYNHCTASDLYGEDTVKSVISCIAGLKA